MVCKAASGASILELWKSIAARQRLKPVNPSGHFAAAGAHSSITGRHNNSSPCKTQARERRRILPSPRAAYCLAAAPAYLYIPGSTTKEQTHELLETPHPPRWHRDHAAGCSCACPARACLLGQHDDRQGLFSYRGRLCELNQKGLQLRQGADLARRWLA